MGQARYFRRGGFGCKPSGVCRLPLFGFFGRLGVFAFYCLSVQVKQEGDAFCLVVGVFTFFVAVGFIYGFVEGGVGFDEVGIACVGRIEFGKRRGRQIFSKRIGAVFLTNVEDGLGGRFDGGA